MELEQTLRAWLCTQRPYFSPTSPLHLPYLLRAWLCTQRLGLASQMPVLVGEAWSGDEMYLLMGRSWVGPGMGLGCA